MASGKTRIECNVMMKKEDICLPDGGRKTAAKIEGRGKCGE